MKHALSFDLLVRFLRGRHLIGSNWEFWRRTARLFPSPSGMSPEARSKRNARGQTSGTNPASWSQCGPGLRGGHARSDPRPLAPCARTRLSRPVLLGSHNLAPVLAAPAGHASVGCTHTLIQPRCGNFYGSWTIWFPKAWRGADDTLEMGGKNHDSTQHDSLTRFLLQRPEA